MQSEPPALRRSRATPPQDVGLRRRDENPRAAWQVVAALRTLACMAGTLPIYRDLPLDGPNNMGRDEHLLHNPQLKPAVLRVYAWSPATLSLGYFQRHREIDSLPEEVRQLAVVRRPTGGGAILHDQEVTYCLVVDPELPLARQAPLALYRLVHDAWRSVLVSAGQPVKAAPDHFPLPSPRSGPFFCFEKPGQTDLIVGPDKLLGSAQRRIPAGDRQRNPAAGRVMQHGSLLLGRRFAAHPGHDLGAPPAELVEQWIAQFIFEVAERLELTPVPAEWTESQLADAADRAARYASPEWTARH